MAFPLPTLASMAIAAFLLAGCVAPAQPAEPLAEAGVADAAPGAFEPVEKDLHVAMYARAGPVFQGSDEGGHWEVEVPAGARFVKAEAMWDPSTPASQEQMLMIHPGTMDDHGEAIAHVMGPSPLATEAAELPPGTTHLVVMCHVGGMVVAEVDQVTHVTVTFS